MPDTEYRAEKLVANCFLHKPSVKLAVEESDHGAVKIGTTWAIRNRSCDTTITNSTVAPSPWPEWFRLSMSDLGT